MSYSQREREIIKSHFGVDPGVIQDPMSPEAIAFRRSTDLVFDDKNPESVSVTKQAHKDECDVNKVVERYMKTGDINAINTISNPNGRFLDASLTQDFKASMDQVESMKSLYNSRPDIQSQFPFVGQFLAAFDTAADPKQQKKLVKLGLLGREALDALNKAEAQPGSSSPGVAPATAQGQPGMSQAPSTGRIEPSGSAPLGAGQGTPEGGPAKEGK